MEKFSLAETVKMLPGSAILASPENICLGSNLTAAKSLGFDNDAEILGATRFDIKNHLIEYADYFVEEDRKVLESKRSMKFIYLVPDKNNNISCALAQKSIFENHGQTYGVLFQSIQLPKTIINNLISLLWNNQEIPHNGYTAYHLNHFDHLPSMYSKLTQRESEVLFYTIRGHSAKEIAKHINISHRTIETYLETIKHRCGCSSKKQIIQKSFADGSVYFLPESLYIAKCAQIR